MTDFHDKATARDNLQTIYPPIRDTDFDRLLKVLDESIEAMKAHEAVPVAPPKPVNRGIVRWFLR